MNGDESAWLPADSPEPRSAADLLSAVVRRRGWAARLQGAGVHDRWIEIAGEQLAAHAQPVRLHGGVLLVRAESAAWATEIRYLSMQLVDRVNAVLGPDQVRRVTVVTGPVRDVESPKPPGR
ncbi:MAG: DUF721 domain-containing protein [Actinomycetota bacterium]|nr:DUF721 domain-containing protein [Actinomycetota bacterium]